MDRIALFEDAQAQDFTPLSLLRPVFELRCGHFSARERVQETIGLTDWGVFLRPVLQETYAEAHPDAHVNDEAWLRAGPTVFVNGRWLGDPRSLPTSAAPDVVGVVEDQVAWLWVDPDEAVLIDPHHAEEGVLRIAATRRPLPAGGALLRYPWDLIHHNAAQLERDFHLRPAAAPPSDPGPQVALQGDRRLMHIDPRAMLDPFVVIDARGGPVWIEADVRLLPFTRVEGPCFIGAGTQLFRAHVRAGTSLGPVCRIGGELEESIFHGFSNKYHDGFLGHSYVGEWVNLGALSTSSDLKNDYSAVKVPLAGVPIDSGSPKVGSFLGDHAKAALCSLFNTGSSIGVMTMLLPGGELLPKHIPSFTRLWHGRLEELPQGIEPSLAVARIAMNRRGRTLTPAMERLLREVYRQTAAERALALQRARQSDPHSSPLR